MIKKFMLGVLLILFAGAVLYTVTPKWHFSHGGMIRSNRITGKCYQWNGSEGIWKLRFKPAAPVKRALRLRDDVGIFDEKNRFANIVSTEE